MKGRETEVAHQRGEHGVCLKLNEMGLLVARFAGNVPDFDIVAVDEHLKTRLVQVKAVQSGDWSVPLRRLANVRYDEASGKQQVLGDKPDLEDLIFVFVRLDDRGDDFYVLKGDALRRIVRENYEAYLAKRGGRRRDTPESFDARVRIADLSRPEDGFRDNWNAFRE